ncbi:bifunctional DNA primase/polymerase, partial [Mycobacterium avium]
MVNGTGGLLVIDIDPKNGGSVDLLRQRFPDLPDTRTVSTVTPHPDGPGVHLIFTIPDDVSVATNRGLGTGIDVPHSVLVPGSKVALDDGTV